jgi:hypothetical protein
MKFRAGFCGGVKRELFATQDGNEVACPHLGTDEVRWVTLCNTFSECWGGGAEVPAPTLLSLGKRTLSWVPRAHL